MAMRQTIEVLNRMKADGAIGRYCISGAVAALNYVEMSSTEVLDILVSFEGVETKPGLVMLAPILSYLKDIGYSKTHKEGIWIEDWPVRVLPAASPLDREALRSAIEVTVEFNVGTVRAWVPKPEHLVAIALRTGRPNDRLCVLQFLETKAADLDELGPLLQRHGLFDALSEFSRSVRLDDPASYKPPMRSGDKAYPDVPTSFSARRRRAPKTPRSVRREDQNAGSTM
jgi:hypothetical protein